MKTGVFYLVLVAALLSACSEQARKIPEFPLEKGTTWVYSYEAYEQGASPSLVVKAAYQLTETVVDVRSTSTGMIAHIERDFEPVTADPEWTGDFSSQQEEIWYVVRDQQVYRSLQQPNGDTFNAEDLGLVYEFPLSVGNSWCLFQSIKATLGCEFVGKREVTGQSSFETQTENFNKCYDLVDYFNTGNFYLTFCNSVGIVHVKFDHPGTRFGFEQTLLDYSPGSP